MVGRLRDLPSGEQGRPSTRNGFAVREDNNGGDVTNQNAVTCTRRGKLLLADIFNMFDQDGSGEIELDELSRAFKSIGKLTEDTQAQLEAHFAFMDSDGSGEVTFDEFRAAVGQGEIAFRNYQHQQVFYSLGLTLTQNLAVYRRHMLHREFENMRKSGTGSLKDQFELLKHALAMSTFALNLREPSNVDHNDGGAARKGQSAMKPGEKAPVGSKEERVAKETRALERILRAGQRSGMLRPLPSRRRPNLRELLASEAAATDDGSTANKTQPSVCGQKRRKVDHAQTKLPPVQDCSSRKTRLSPPPPHRYKLRHEHHRRRQLPILVTS